MKNEKNIKIFGAYPWSISVDDDTMNSKTKNKFSPLAIKELINRVQVRLDYFGQKNPNIQLPKLFYSRMRATSGTFVFSSIRERMKSAYAIIFDITDYNPNVMIELGIALELQQNLQNSAKVFIIACAEKYSDSLIPSDIRGYFLSTYRIDSQTNNVNFGDNGSLVMRIFSDIIELLQINYIEDSYES
jgi:hypothetical protein